MWSFTPLHEAVSKMRVQVCSLLLAHKADPYARNCYDKSPFDVALEQATTTTTTATKPSSGEILLFDKLLFDYYGYSLLDAIRNNDFFKVKRILNHLDIEQVRAEMLKQNSTTASSTETKKEDDVGSEEKQLSGFNLIEFKDCETLNTPLVRYL